MNVVTSAHAPEARNFGGGVHPAKETRYRRAREFVEVVNGLRDSFDEGALTFDRGNAQFDDPAKLHVLHHDGEFFKARGPLMIPNHPQGRPIVVQARASEDGRQRAADTAEVVFTAQAGGRCHFQLIGSPTHGADVMESWFHCGAADGFNVIPPIFPTGVEQTVRHLTPELQRRGLFRTAYDGKTLRQKLGLPTPVSRFA